MNAALNICQERFDALLPAEAPDDSEVEREWLEHAAEQLVCGADVSWKRRYSKAFTVTADQFATYLQGHLNQRQIDGKDERDSFARLVLAAVVGSQSEAYSHAGDLLGSGRPVQALEQIAIDMLRPYAPEAVAAEREAHEDDVDGDL